MSKNRDVPKCPKIDGACRLCGGELVIRQTSILDDVGAPALIYGCRNFYAKSRCRYTAKVTTDDKTAYWEWKRALAKPAPEPMQLTLFDVSKLPTPLASYEASCLRHYSRVAPIAGPFIGACLTPDEDFCWIRLGWTRAYSAVGVGTGGTPSN